MKTVLISMSAAKYEDGVVKWGAILSCEGHTKALKGQLVARHSAAGELEALREALKALKVPCEVKIVSNDNLVPGWIRDGWKIKAAWAAMPVAEIVATARAKGIEIEFTGDLGRIDHRAELNAAHAIARGR